MCYVRYQKRIINMYRYSRRLTGNSSVARFLKHLIFISTPANEVTHGDDQSQLPNLRSSISCRTRRPITSVPPCVVYLNKKIIEPHTIEIHLFFNSNRIQFYRCARSLTFSILNGGILAVAVCTLCWRLIGGFRFEAPRCNTVFDIRIHAVKMLARDCRQPGRAFQPMRPPDKDAERKLKSRWKKEMLEAGTVLQTY